MQKSEGPWYRKFNNNWYAIIHGDKLPLGKHPDQSDGKVHFIYSRIDLA